MIGKGRSYYLKGSFYEGKWDDGKENGFGILTWENQDKYVGEWVDG